MVKQYLESIRQEFIEHKDSLEEQVVACENKWKENEKFIQMLQETRDPNVEAFSPRELHSFQKGKITEMHEEQKKISGELVSLKDQLQEYRFRIADITSVIKELDSAAEQSDPDADLYETRLSLLRSVESERQRIARELHDSTTQSLTALVHKTELCYKLMDSDSAKCKSELYALGQSLRSIIDEMRGMIYDLRPMSFDDIGFSVTVERTLDHYEEHYGITCRFCMEGDQYPLDSVVQITLLRVIQEACTNTIKHANAAQIKVTLAFFETKILLTIEDDGQGFEAASVMKESRKDHSGFGLSMMRERVYLMSGTISVKSEPGQGSTIVVTIPSKIARSRS